jgi:hypothetical protein
MYYLLYDHKWKIHFSRDLRLIKLATGRSRNDNGKIIPGLHMRVS